MQVEQMYNGYLVTIGSRRMVFATLVEVFNDMLMTFEGRSKHFGRSLYGEVIIKGDEHDQTQNSTR